MAAPETGPGSLAQLFAQRRRLSGRTGASAAFPKGPEADAAGQFGLLFSDPKSDPEIEQSGENESGRDAPSAGSSSATPIPPFGAPSVAANAVPGAIDTEENASRSSVVRGRAPERKLWSVAELVGVLRGRLEREFAEVWVEGEISNCRPAASGHLYFTLKDGDAQLGVVLFRAKASLLKWRPEDGLAVLVRGRVSIFEGRGQLQLIAESLQPRGAGALQLQFEQLKQSLRAEGFFDAERKKPLPPYPRTIGVVTSVQGAVIRDFVTVCRRRHACVNILIYPAKVQGSGASAEIAAGVRFFNESKQYRADVIVVARGGGSTEDLWAFNEEGLARVIAASDLPVVSAVGHETDFTIADFVADLRAPTPSAAAEMITEQQHRLEERLQGFEARLRRGIRYQQMLSRQRFAHIAAEGVLRRMRDGIERRQQRLDDLHGRLERQGQALAAQRGLRLLGLRERLRRQDVGNRIARVRSRLDLGEMRLRRLAMSLVQPGRQRVQNAGYRLQALSPMAVLERGYALAFTADGQLLRSVQQVSAGSEIVTRLSDGDLKSRVTEVQYGDGARNGRMENNDRLQGGDGNAALQVPPPDR